MSRAPRRGGGPEPADPLAVLSRDRERAGWLLHGEETFLVERGLAILKRRALDGGSAHVRTLWADEDAAALPDALDALAAPSLFGGRPSLVIRRAEALGGADERAVLEAVARIQAPSCLVLVARTLDARRTLRTTFERAGAAVAFSRVNEPRAVRDWVVRMAREAGTTIRSDAADRLIDRTTLDLAALASEIEKASLYVDPGAGIDLAAIDAVACLGRGAAVEELTDRIGRGDGPGAHRALANLLAAGEPPIRIVAFLAASVRRALQVAELAESGLDEAAIASTLGMPAWLVRRIRGPRRARQLEESLGILAALDLGLKRSRPAAETFAAAVAAMTAPTGRRP